MLVSGGCISKCIWNTRCTPWKSKSTKLCPLVGSGILYMNHPKDQPLCLVLDLQGISILSLPSAKTNMAMAIYLSQFEIHLQMVDFLSNWLMPIMPGNMITMSTPLPIRFSNGVVKLCSMSCEGPFYLRSRIFSFMRLNLRKCSICMTPHLKHTPQKFNIAPEKWWLENYFPFGMVYIQGLC